MHKKILTLILTSFCFLSIGFATNYQGGNVLNFKQPLADLHISVSGCTYDVLLNGVSIMKDDDGIPVTVNYPVNEWMQAKHNTLALKLGPVKDAQELVQDGQQCKASVALAIRNHGYPKSKAIIISHLNYHATATHLTTLHQQTKGSTPDGNYVLENGKLIKDDSGKIIQEPITLQSSKAPHGMGVLVSRTVEAPLHYPTWAWTKGEIIKNDKQTKEELTQFFQTLFHNIKTKNFKAIKPLFALRQKELDEAYYMPANSPSTFEDLKQTIINRNSTLVPLHPKYYELKIFSDGRLARLYYNIDNTPLLTFNFSNPNSSSSYELTFAKLNGKWTIVR